MNWTGGDLSRAAPTKAKALQSKQKAYFARARAGALQRSELTQAALPGRNHTRSSSWRSIDPVEHQLLQKRQELLQRPDWLSLQATKPLQVQSEFGSDKALVGRRRRLDMRPGHVHKHKSHRIRTAPVNHALKPFEAYGHMPDSEETSLRIKLGTDALESGTETIPSMRKRVQSEHLSDLSEEPMLLDSQDDLGQWDDFEAQYMDPVQTSYSVRNVPVSSVLLQSPETPVHWSTSVIEARSEAGDASEETKEDTQSSEQQQRAHTRKSKDIGYKNTSMMAQWSPPVFSAIAATPAQGWPQAHVRGPLPQSRLKPLTHPLATENGVVSRTITTAQLASSSTYPQHDQRITEVARMQPVTPKRFDEEDAWRRFILGPSRSASDDSISTKSAYAGKPMPSNEIMSTTATRGASSIFHGFAQPRIPPTARTDKTTAAIASSSSM